MNRIGADLSPVGLDGRTADGKHIDIDSIRRLFSPKSIAVYGASGDLKKIGGRALNYMRMMDFSGEIYPINVQRDEVQGLKAYPSIAAVPGEVDLAIIVVPAKFVLDAMRDCAQNGVHSVLIVTSGFSEIGPEGQVAQREIEMLAREHGARLLGPNCLGFVNSAEQVSATFSPSRELCWPGVGSIGFASQSGAFASLCAGVMRDRGMGLGTWITTGNEADVDLADAIAFLADDDSVNVIACYMEGCRNATKLGEALDMARRAGKPVIMLKVGTSDVGAAAAASHTASMAGRDELFSAFFAAFGVTRVNSVQELLDASYACSASSLPAGPRTLIVSTSGGVGVLMSDASVHSGLTVDPLPESAQEEIRAILPYAGTRNPIDTTAQIIADMSVFNQCFEVTIEAARADIVVIHLSLLGYDDTMMDQITEPLGQLRRRYPDRVFVISMLSGDARRQTFENAGFLVFSDPSRAIFSVALARRARERLEAAPAEAQATLARLPRPDAVETEDDALQFIADAGVPVPRRAVATSAEEAKRIAAEIRGRVVLKIVSPDIQHKTEVGGVILGIEGAEAVGRAYDEILMRVARAAPKARIAGVLVAEQIGAGTETIAGVVNDPVLGPFIMFGLGGIYAEVLKDVVFRRAPFDEAEARRMIGELRATAVLTGARGQQPADIDGLASALSRLSELACRGSDWIESIDINPLIATPTGVHAADALIVPKAPA
ncbi:MAG: acetate--CoA ligase family protein [Amaricoccus sp.]